MQPNGFARGVFAVLLITLLSVTTYSTYQAYKWKHWAEVHANLALQAGSYLFQPTDVKDASGKSLRRVDLIDALLAQAVKSAQQSK